MNSDELEELLNELLLGIQETIASGEILSDEFQGVLAQTLNGLYEDIERLRSEEAAAAEEQTIQPEGPVPSEEILLLWILSGQQEQAFISYLRDYPSAQTRSLLQNPHELARIMEYLLTMYPPSPKVAIDGIRHADLNSSNVWGSSYNQRDREMIVRFQGGSEYRYFNIPPNIYRAFKMGNAQARTSGENQYGKWWEGKNPSLGAALHQFIKEAGFPYERVS